MFNSSLMSKKCQFNATKITIILIKCILILGTVCNAVLSPSNSRPQSRDSYSSLGSGLSSGPLPALQLIEAPALLRLEEEPALQCSDEAEDHEMSTEIPESRPLSCQSEPLNLAVGIIESTRPPSRPMRGALSNVDLAVQEAQQAAAQGKARLPAKIRLKSQLSPTASQVRYRLFKLRYF